MFMRTGEGPGKNPGAEHDGTCPPALGRNPFPIRVVRDISPLCSQPGRQAWVRG